MSMDKQSTQRAVDALLQFKNTKTKSEKPQLLPQNDFLYLVLTLKKIPQKGNGGARLNPYKIPLPHPLFVQDSFPELCLIIDDRPNSKLTSDLAKKKIKSEEIPVTKVIKLSKLKTDYRPFEAKRKLCNSYDMFFADKRIIPLLPKLLGKQFFKKMKLPLPVDLTHKNWKEQIEKACSAALLSLKTGTCSVVRVAKVSMERDEIVENVDAAIDGVVGFVPKKWAGVRSLYLKFSESLALPLYQALPSFTLKIQGIKENVEEEKGGDGEIVMKEESKKGEKLGKKKSAKKGRIHEVQYMDSTSMDEDGLGSDNDGDNNENVMSEKDDLGSAEFVGDKRKKGDSEKKKRVLSELNGEKPAKKKSKVKKGSKDDDESKPRESKDLSSAGKKKRKGELVKEKVVQEKSIEKRAKKASKKGSKDDDESKPRESKDLISAGKKKRKGELVKEKVVQEKSIEKRAKKTSKKGEGEKKEWRK